jgi:hypothetical protein
MAILNLTRDDLKWAWGYLVSGASIVLLDQTAIGAYLGLSTIAIHWVIAVCIVVLFVSGKLGTSPLPGSGAK